MKRLLIIGILVLISNPLFSQSDGAWFVLNNKNIDLVQKWESFGINEERINAIKNEAYANPNFINGNIYQEDQLIKADVSMRYNAYADEIEIKKYASDENYGALTKDPSIFVKLGLDVYVFAPYEGSNEKGGYFNVLSDGKKYDLYKKITTFFVEPRIAKTSYERDIPPSFSKKVKYYLVQNGTFLEMPSSKSKVLKMMAAKKDEVKNYIIQNDIDLNTERDLVKLVSYFDSLL
ncbi:hypothetical protein [Aequorivita sp. Q41]|uniref:hypothetical protein n=1 Tax=Aequorivita sp. Q41 TaxID=3153300 RepID=UPI0032427DF8